MNVSCQGIDHCVSCHRGHSHIWYVCESCESGYGVDTKYTSSDICIWCDSAIPNCIACSNPIDAWNCS